MLIITTCEVKVTIVRSLEICSRDHLEDDQIEGRVGPHPTSILHVIAVKKQSNMHGCMAYDMMIRSSAGPRGKQGVHFRNLVFCRKPCCHKHDRLLFCLKCFVCLPVILYWTGIHVNRLWKLSTSFQRSTCMCQHESGQQKLCDCC